MTDIEIARNTKLEKITEVKNGLLLINTNLVV